MIVGVEGEHADHLTTATAFCNILVLAVEKPLLVYLLAIFAVIVYERHRSMVTVLKAVVPKIPTIV